MPCAALRSRATIAELLEAALAATDFEGRLPDRSSRGRRRSPTSAKLIELARDLDAAAAGRRFTNSCRRMAVHFDLDDARPREPEAHARRELDDVVRLMTIHQAKGLEFAVVVLPDLGAAWSPTAARWRSTSRSA